MNDISEYEFNRIKYLISNYKKDKHKYINDIKDEYGAIIYSCNKLNNNKDKYKCKEEELNKFTNSFNVEYIDGLICGLKRKNEHLNIYKNLDKKIFDNSINGYKTGRNMIDFYSDKIQQCYIIILIFIMCFIIIIKNKK